MLSGDIHLDQIIEGKRLAPFINIFTVVVKVRQIH